MSSASGPRPFLQGPLPLAFAHRGGALLWPENTLTAYRGALGVCAGFVLLSMLMTLLLKETRGLNIYHQLRGQAGPAARP